jgi:3-phenylpropionate/trans-cinnamate dioxygenase ferredoxin component
VASPRVCSSTSGPVAVPEVHVAPLAEFGPGSVKIVTVGWTSIGVYNCGGELYALEDRCSHDDGPLCEGEWEEDSCRVICPRHGSAFDLRTGRPLSLPAFEPVDTYDVVVRDGVVLVVVADVHP